MSNSNIHLISASAGSGKTYELMEQLYSEISQKSASPSSIMAVTFTNKAANELVTRVQQKLILQGGVSTLVSNGCCTNWNSPFYLRKPVKIFCL
jgi:superfamily I DNA/RNA helicase